MAKKGLGIVEKIACQIDVVEQLVLNLTNCPAIKTQNGSAGESEDDGGVRGDDELRVLFSHLFERGKETQLTGG